MPNEKISPVILSGGAGTRLWPLSRTALPKQMLRLVGEASLIQSALMRAPQGAGFEPPVIVAGAAHRKLVEEQMVEIGVIAHTLILEPVGRNTAPAIALAALELEPDMLMLVMPSDQVIADVPSFHAAIAAAAPLAAEGWLVTFGITPTGPETGYGYIEAAEALVPGVRRVARFVEKPDIAAARSYAESGAYFWNAGIFLIRAGTYLEALSNHAPTIDAAVRAAHTLARREGIVLIPGAKAFASVPGNSIDYAIMEKADRVAVAPASIGWSDIGAFAALWEQLPHDGDGNAIAGDAIVRDSTNCLIRSDGPLVAAIGISGVSVIATADAVLVVAHDRAQDVKHIAETLKQQRPDLLDHPAREFSPWGSRQRLVTASGLAADLYEVVPGAAVTLALGGSAFATLCTGGASINGMALEIGMPAGIDGDPALLATTGSITARVLVTISRENDDIG